MDRVGVSRLFRRVGFAVVNDGVVEQDERSGLHLREQARGGGVGGGWRLRARRRIMVAKPRAKLRWSVDAFTSGKRRRLKDDVRTAEISEQREIRPPAKPMGQTFGWVRPTRSRRCVESKRPARLPRCSTRSPQELKKI